jgi:antitoxin Phd
LPELTNPPNLGDKGSVAATRASAGSPRQEISMNRALAPLPDFSSATDFSASAAKAKLGEVIDLVAAGGVATITRRGRQRFAVLKLETLEALVAAAKERELEALGDRYDDLVARMQTPDAKAATDSLFTASGEEIGADAATASEQSPGAATAAGAGTQKPPGVTRTALTAVTGGRAIPKTPKKPNKPTDIRTARRSKKPRR